MRRLIAAAFFVTMTVSAHARPDYAKIKEATARLKDLIHERTGDARINIRSGDKFTEDDWSGILAGLSPEDAEVMCKRYAKAGGGDALVAAVEKLAPQSACAAEWRIRPLDAPAPGEASPPSKTDRKAAEAGKARAADARSRSEVIAKNLVKEAPASGKKARAPVETVTGNAHPIQSWHAQACAQDAGAPGCAAGSGAVAKLENADQARFDELCRNGLVKNLQSELTPIDDAVGRRGEAGRECRSKIQAAYANISNACARHARVAPDLLHRELREALDCAKRVTAAPSESAKGEISPRADAPEKPWTGSRGFR